MSKKWVIRRTGGCSEGENTSEDVRLTLGFAYLLGISTIYIYAVVVTFNTLEQSQMPNAWKFSF